jgi:hypothetical protein
LSLRHQWLKFAFAILVLDLFNARLLLADEFDSQPLKILPVKTIVSPESEKRKEKASRKLASEETPEQVVNRPPVLTPRYLEPVPENYGFAVGISQNIGLTGPGGSPTGGYYPAHGMATKSGFTIGSTSPNARSNSETPPSEVFPWIYDSGPATGTGSLGDPSSFGGPVDSGGGIGHFGSASSTTLTARGGYLFTPSFGVYFSAIDSIPEAQIAGASSPTGTANTSTTSGTGTTTAGSTTGSSSLAGLGNANNQSTILNTGASYKISDVVRLSANLT